MSRALVDVSELVDRILEYPELVVLTGAGVSSGSGIPTYRDDRGEWQRRHPIQHQEFITHETGRQRYWARSMVGWRTVAESTPNPAHHALAELERLGYVDLLVTQNVDRLHQRAGHRRVVDLHGRLDQVSCRGCGATIDRSQFQSELEAMNPRYRQDVGSPRPDGDAEVLEDDVAGFGVPPCAACGGVLMPDVVFFGGQVPKSRVARINRAIERAQALLVAGSSLMVYSGFRFCRLARDLGKPLLIVNRGRTRADDLADLKLEHDCGVVLEQLVHRLG